MQSTVPRSTSSLPHGLGRPSVLVPILVAVLAGLAQGPTLAGAQTEVSRTVDLEAGGTVEIENIAGSVAIGSWDEPKVKVEGTLGRGVEELEVKSSGGRVWIEVATRGRSKQGHRAELRIRVPSTSRVRIETVNAETLVDAELGSLVVETVSGASRFEGKAESVEIESVSGAVELRGEVERLRVETVSGTVRFEGKAPRLDASSVNGRLDLRPSRLERGQIETMNGRLGLETSLADGARLDASTHSGTLDLRLPVDVSARFDIETFSGRLINELPAKGAGTSRVSRGFGPSKEVTFVLGEGSARVELSSFSGSIRLRSE